MRNIVLNTFFIVLCVCLQARALYTNALSLIDVDTHLAQFKEVNQTHHDNIDDEVHIHTHRHSEDGEDHDHHHEHDKVAQYELQLISSSQCGIVTIFIDITNNNFFEKNHFSNAYPNELFRPPIV